MHRLKLGVILAVAFGLVLGFGLRAQEHPKQEHPKKEEHPTAKAASTADIDKAIRAHIDQTAKANHGRFPVKDDVLKKTWALALEKVHTDKLTALDANTYFACVDFKADDGTAVDADFYLKGEKGSLKVTDTTVHKINGEPRFNYEKKGDYWERVSTSKAQEHPKSEPPKKAEHPKE
ncbi:MAG: hypothetical protein HY656_02015 [Acidobacteria bacterium]|nr:hypothetical protein [Acidobacteriota bacterium]